jgi:transposase
MSNLYWLSDAQMARLTPFFPTSHGKPRVDDRRVLSGIIFINRNGLRWCDAPRKYEPAKPLYNRWKRWSNNGCFARIMFGLRAPEAKAQRKAEAFQLVDTMLLNPDFRARVAAIAARRGVPRACARPVAATMPLAAG